VLNASRHHSNEHPPLSFESLGKHESGSCFTYSKKMDMVRNGREHLLVFYNMGTSGFVMFMHGEIVREPRIVVNYGRFCVFSLLPLPTSGGA
jgi:hypothetical protein